MFKLPCSGKGRKKITGYETFDHKKLTTRISSENCIKCHNRSPGIGLSYFGKYESEGYGTPFNGKALNERKLSGKRFYLTLPHDIHFKKACMDCIDCHTGIGVMSDGSRYQYMKEQLDITCISCHDPSFSKVKNDNEIVKKLTFLNNKIPAATDLDIAFSKKGTPLYNLRKKIIRFSTEKMTGNLLS